MSQNNIADESQNGDIVKLQARTRVQVLFAGRKVQFDVEHNFLQIYTPPGVAGAQEILFDGGSALPATAKKNSAFLLTQDDGENKQGLYVAFAENVWTRYGDPDVENWAKKNGGLIPPARSRRQYKVTRTAGAYAAAGAGNIVVRATPRQLAIEQDASGLFARGELFAGANLVIGGWNYPIESYENFKQIQGHDFLVLNVGVDLPELTDGDEYTIGFLQPEWTGADDLKLQNIEDGAEKNIQSDFGVDDPANPAHIKRRPTGATVVGWLSALRGNARLSYTALKDQLTDAQLVARINALIGNARISYAALKDTPAALTGERVKNLLAGLVGNARLSYNNLKDTLTPPRIKQMYESNADTNAFTNAKSLKLDALNLRYITNFLYRADKKVEISFTDGAGTAQKLTTDSIPFLSLEQIQDAIANFIRPGAGLTKTYNDNAGTLTLASSMRLRFVGEWVAGSNQIANSITTYRGVVYYVANDVANSQTAPNADNANYIALSVDTGIIQVETDATLTGLGTAQNPLKVANPFTQAFATKLGALNFRGPINIVKTYANNQLTTTLNYTDGDGNAQSVSDSVQIVEGTNPSQETIYNLLKIILGEGSNITLNEDDGAHTISFSAPDNPDELTDLQIKTKYENNPDTNNFSDAEKAVVASAIETLTAGALVSITANGRERTISVELPDPNDNPDFINIDADWFSVLYQAKNSPAPKPEWQFDQEINPATRSITTRPNLKIFSNNNQTALELSIQYTQYQNGGVDAGKLVINTPSGTQPNELWSRGDWKKIKMVVNGDPYEFNLTQTRPLNAENETTVIFTAMPFADANFEAADSQAAAFWRAGATVAANVASYNFVNSDGVEMFGSEGSPTQKRFLKEDFAAWITTLATAAARAVAVAPVPQRTFAQIWAGIKNFVIQQIASTTQNHTTNETIFQRSFNYILSGVAGSRQVRISALSNNFTVDGTQFTLSGITDYLDEDHFGIFLKDTSDENLAKLNNVNFRITADGPVYNFGERFFTTDRDADIVNPPVADREMQFHRQGSKLAAGSHQFTIFEPITADNFVVGAPTTNDQMYATASNSRVPAWRSIADFITRVKTVILNAIPGGVQSNHDGPITGLSISSFQTSQVSQSNLSTSILLDNSGTHRILEGSLTLTRTQGSAGSDFGGNDTTKTISFVGDSSDVWRSATYDGSNNFGVKVGEVPIFVGATRVGTVLLFLSKSRNNYLAATLRYVSNPGDATVGNMTVSARLTLDSIRVGATLGGDTGTAGIFIFKDGGLPNAMVNIAQDQIMFLTKKVGDSLPGFWRRIHTVTDAGGTDVGYNATAVNVNAAMFASGVRQSLSYKGYVAAATMIRAVNFPAGGALAPANALIQAIMLTQDNITGHNARVDLVFKTARTYAGSIVVVAGNTEIVLTRQSSTHWQSSILGAYTHNIINQASIWSITAPNGTNVVIAESNQFIVGRTENLTEAQFQAKVTAGTLEPGVVYNREQA